MSSLISRIDSLLGADGAIVQQVSQLLTNRYSEDREHLDEFYAVRQCADLQLNAALQQQVSSYADMAASVLVTGILQHQQHPSSSCQPGRSDHDHLCSNEQVLLSEIHGIKDKYHMWEAAPSGQRQEQSCCGDQKRANTLTVVSMKACDYIEEVLYTVASLTQVSAEHYVKVVASVHLLQRYLQSSMTCMRAQ
jgi:hypothetical protein